MADIATAVSSTDAPPTNTPEPISVPETAVTNISLTPLITTGLIRPVYLTHAGDDRLFVVEQRGLIRIIANGELIDQPFLNIEERVGDESNEQGLLSVAFDPEYDVNGRFFVNYTNNNGDTVISRFQVSSDPQTADPQSETILLTIPQPFRNHNGGQVKFGPDDYLYIGMGDGGSQGDPQNNSQNPNSLLGSILRLDVNQNPYGIPASNPYLSNKTARAETWAIGFRNPWRFSFDRLTGDLFIADVGQNTWEEISHQPASSLGGQNYGWNIIEGNHCYLQCQLPHQWLDQAHFLSMIITLVVLLQVATFIVAYSSPNYQATTSWLTIARVSFGASFKKPMALGQIMKC